MQKMDAKLQLELDDGTQKASDNIDAMFEEIMMTMTEILSEMTQKIDDQYLQLETNLTTADQEIENSLNLGMDEIDQEFQDPLNVEAREMLSMLGLQDFASLRNGEIIRTKLKFSSILDHFQFEKLVYILSEDDYFVKGYFV